jgi:hypothetical protein
MGVFLISNFSLLYAFKGTQEGYAVSDFQFRICLYSFTAKKQVKTGIL